MKTLFALAFLAALLALTSCTTIPPSPAPQITPSQTPQYRAVWDGQKDASTWTQELVNAIHNYGDALPEPVQPAAVAVPVKCERIQFYVAFFSAIAYYESGFNTNAKYVENFKGDDGSLQVSGGLLQESLDDAKVNGCSEFSKEADLYDAGKNLACGVKICAKWAAKDGVLLSGSGEAASPARGCARYWSVLREGVKHHKQEILTAAWGTCK